MMDENHESWVKDADSKQLITNEQLHDFRDTFKLFDKDGDGRLSKRDLSDVMKRLGQAMTEEQLDVSRPGCLESLNKTILHFCAEGAQTICANCSYGAQHRGM
mmetsp:Transcript_24346/g.41902  ORF Transcript_24346/g.41902 Transcript_24346/m.41902 type:complete len:103 (+) Transcript_24346:157-465(+)